MSVKIRSFLSAFDVFTVAAKPGPILARNGLSVNPHHALADCPKPDILLVPGGTGTRSELNNERHIEWIRQVAIDAELGLSVCTGALLLGKAGLLDGLEATTHHVAYDLLRELVPTCMVHEDRRFVDNGKVRATFRQQHFLYFFPLPQGRGALRLTFTLPTDGSDRETSSDTAAVVVSQVASRRAGRSARLRRPISFTSR